MNNMSPTTTATSVLLSKTKMRILLTLADVREINITRLTSMLGLNHKVVKESVEELERMGIVRVLRVGRAKIVMLNTRDPRVRRIIELVGELRALEEAQAQQAIHSSN